MIQFKGEIKTPDGASYDGNTFIINVNMKTTQKFEPTYGRAEIGTLVGGESYVSIPEQTDENGIITVQEVISQMPIRFVKVVQIGIYPYNEPNPDFDSVQNSVLEGLKNDFEGVIFEIVK